MLFLNKALSTRNHLGFFNHRDLATCCLDNSHIDDAILSKDLIDPAQKEKWQSDLVRKFHDELLILSHFHDTAIISSEHFHSRLTSKRNSKFTSVIKFIF